MALSDPSGGSGYSQGDKLPPSHITSLASQIADALHKNGVDTLSGTTDLTGTLTATAAVITIDSDTAYTVETLLVLSGSESGISHRQDTVTLGNADADITVAADTYHCQTNLTANRVYTLRHTGPVVPSVGQRIRVVRDNDGNHTMTFLAEGTGVGAVFEAGNGNAWLEFEYFGGGEWRIIGWGAAGGGVNGQVYVWDGSTHDLVIAPV